VAIIAEKSPETGVIACIELATRKHHRHIRSRHRESQHLINALEELGVASRRAAHRVELIDDQHAGCLGTNSRERGRRRHWEIQLGREGFWRCRRPPAIKPENQVSDSFIVQLLCELVEHVAFPRARCSLHEDDLLRGDGVADTGRLWA
jgi:hypothetical protein